MQKKKVILLSILLLCTIVTTSNFLIKPVFAITTYRNDNFEDFPTWWTVIASNGGIFDKSNITAYSGSYSARCMSLYSPTEAYATNTTTGIGYHHTVMYVYLNSSYTGDASGYLCLMGGSSYGEDLYWFKNETGWYLVNYDGSSGNIVSFINRDVWNKFEWFYYPNPTRKVSIYINDIWKGNYTSYQGGIGLTTFYIGDPSTDANGLYGYYDDLLQDDKLEIPTVSSILYNNMNVDNGNETISNWIFRSFWYTIDCNLSGYILSHNISATMENETWITFNELNNSWVNITKTIINDVGNYISWKLYANSSLNVWNSTSIQNILITATLTFYFNSGGVFEKNGTQLENGTIIIYNSLKPHILLSALPDTNKSWFNFTISGIEITSNRLNFIVQNKTDIWCTFGIVSYGTTEDYSFYFAIAFILLAIGFLIGLLLGKG